VSEYQYYEFQAIDRRLTAAEMTELRFVLDARTDYVDEFRQRLPVGRFQRKRECARKPSFIAKLRRAGLRIP
jgi:hypothetical protein